MTSNSNLDRAEAMVTGINSMLLGLSRLVSSTGEAPTQAAIRVLDIRTMDLSKRMEAMLDELRPLKTNLEADFEHEKKERLAAITAQDNTLAKERQRLLDLECQLNARQEAIDKTERLRGSLDDQQGLLDSINTNLKRRQELADEAEAQLKSAQQSHTFLQSQYDVKVRNLETERQAFDKTRTDLKEQAERLERAKREHEVKAKDYEKEMDRMKQMIVDEFDKINADTEAVKTERAGLQSQEDALNARDKRMAVREAVCNGKEESLRRIQGGIRSQVTTFTPTLECADTTIQEKGSATVDKVFKDLQGQLQEARKKASEPVKVNQAQIDHIVQRLENAQLTAKTDIIRSLADTKDSLVKKVDGLEVDTAHLTALIEISSETIDKVKEIVENVSGRVEDDLEVVFKPEEHAMLTNCSEQTEKLTAAVTELKQAVAAMSGRIMSAPTKRVSDVSSEGSASAPKRPRREAGLQTPHQGSSRQSEAGPGSSRQAIPTRTRSSTAQEPQEQQDPTGSSSQGDRSRGLRGGSSAGSAEPSISGQANDQPDIAAASDYAQRTWRQIEFSGEWTPEAKTWLFELLVTRCQAGEDHKYAPHKVLDTCASSAKPVCFKTKILKGKQSAYENDWANACNNCAGNNGNCIGVKNTDPNSLSEGKKWLLELRPEPSLK
ncbi:MAG: hypothetical protein LQ346_003330 [Caloplaca aetnensis]|nr:MAG: hypothetical protein LQ346_003330 [Caloplaca aetnensis]